MWEMLRNILLYDMLYDTVSNSNSLSYAMSYDSIKQKQWITISRTIEKWPDSVNNMQNQFDCHFNKLSNTSSARNQRQNNIYESVKEINQSEVTVVVVFFSPFLLSKRKINVIDCTSSSSCVATILMVS